MEIPAYEKGEISCRACERFTTGFSCWKQVDSLGNDCKSFKLRANIERYLPVKKEALK